MTEITPEQQAKLNEIYAQAYCILQTTCKELAYIFAGNKLKEYEEEEILSNL